MELNRDQLQQKLDIAQAKIADLEYELQIKEETYSRYLALSEVILVAIDDQARITMIGGKGCELMGYSSEELIGQNWFQVCLPADNYEKVFAIYKNLMAGNIAHVEYFENEILNKSGKKRYIAWHNSLLKDSSGNVIGTLSSGVDITERKLVEDSLRENEVILDKVQEIAHIGSWDWDTINNTAKLSPELYKIYDISPGQFDGDIESLGKVIHPDDWDKVVKTQERTIKEGKPQQTEFRILQQDGSIRHVWGAGTNTFDDNGVIVRTIGIVQDITERKKIEDELRESESRFRMIVETAQEGIWTVDVDKITTFVNSAMANMLGYKAKEMIGRSMFDFMDKEGVELSSRSVERQKAGINDQLDFKFICKNGSIVLTEVYANSLYDAEGSYIGSLAMVTNVTERKNSELALHNSQKLLLRTESLAHVGSWEWDLATDQVQWSPEMYQIYHYDPIEYPIIDFSLTMERTHHDDVKRIEQYIKNLLETGKISSIETRIILPGGEVRHLWSESEVIRNADGHPTHMVGFIQDITDRTLSEEALRRSQKMDALGKLTGGIAHDYNNMLGVILGYAQLLKDAVNDDSELSKYVYEIQHASERGSKLSRKLMGFSRNIQPKADCMDVNCVLLSESDMLQKALTPRIDLVFDLVEKSWPIYVNSGEFEDAILNLCINAMHAMASGGKLTIKTSNQKLSLREANKFKLPSGEYLVLTISDTGEGIDSSDLNCIFDPFFTTKGEAGIGLGLSMVYGFVQRSAGAIVVDSTQGRGTQFKLFFPRYKQMPFAKVEVEEFNKEKFQGNETILIVDDEPAMVNLSKKILSKNGYQVLVANNAEDALDILNNHSVDMLLSDVIMPGRDGYQLAAKVREINSKIKILLVSGFTENRHVGNDGSKIEETLLQKPFTPENLLVNIRNVLDKHEMSEKKHTILVMDDDENIRKLFEINLIKLGYDVVFANDGMEAISIYQDSMGSSQTINIAILDISVPGGMGGKEAAEKILIIDPNAKLIVSSGDSYGPEMINFEEYGFKAMLEKNFDREEMQKIFTELIQSS